MGLPENPFAAGILELRGGLVAVSIMANHIRRSWSWDFERPVAQVWPIFADTTRWNEALAMPKYEVDEVLQPDGAVHFLARGNMGRLAMRWRELPVNWVSNQWFEHKRLFDKGPFSRFDVTVEFESSEPGCRCCYTIDAVPANMAGRLLCWTMFGSIYRSFCKLIEHARDHLRDGTGMLFDYVPPELPPGARERALHIATKIDASGYGNGLGTRLVEYVLSAQEADLVRVRPLSLARRWGVESRDVVELCLEAVVAGLLGSRWALLCPRCRVGKSSSGALDQLPSGAHCSSCNIDYERDFARNVELSFHPAPSIRPITSGEYCWLSPMSTPHIKGQISLRPGELRTLDVAFDDGAYRLRTLEMGGAVDWTLRDGMPPQIVVDGEQVSAQAGSAAGKLSLRNAGSRETTVVIEEREWIREALTAKRVTTLQVFYDLFSEDVLRPGDDVSIDSVTFMFTDLKGSTTLFEDVGDARAYHLVREHFAILGEVIREHDGAIVKTIGDGVHAAFANPADAVRAGVAMQAAVHEFNRSSNLDDITIRIGMHGGKSISVTLNDRLDYYGSTVNMAARLEAQCRGGDIVLSETVMGEPEVRDALRAYRVERETANLKGFSGGVPIYRILPESLKAVRDVIAAGMSPQREETV
jgi:class 3 adenylate cyclase